MAKVSPLELDITALGTNTVLSDGVRLHLQEAAYVALKRHHAPAKTPATLVEGADGQSEEALLCWREPTDLEVASHQNTKDTTEYAAYAVAAALVHAKLGFTVIGRMQQGTGSDFWMLKDSDDENDIVRLEVSGIDDGTLSDRLNKKLDQLQDGKSELPGIAVVARIKQATVHVQRESA